MCCVVHRMKLDGRGSVAGVTGLARIYHSNAVRAGFDMGSFLFSSFAGLRGAVSLILAQQLVLDQSQYPHEARVIAEVCVSTLTHNWMAFCHQPTIRLCV